MTRGQLVLAIASALGVLALGAVAAVAATSFGQGPAARAANSITFIDLVGDAPTGVPDISSVNVTSDDTGLLTFTISTSGLEKLASLDVSIDADRNPATGPQTGGRLAGCEIMLAIVRNNSDAVSGRVFAWDGQFMKVTTRPSFTSSLEGGTARFQIGKDDLGTTTGFMFSIQASTQQSGTAYIVLGYDFAPDNGTWSFDLNPAPPTSSTAQTTTVTRRVIPLIGRPTTTPHKAHAGQRFTVIFPVTRSDTGRRLMSGTMRCDPSFRDRLIAHSESFRNGIARLTFTVPKGAAGTRLNVKVTITFHGTSTTRNATFPIA
jgi:hypothetical protein